MNGYCYLIIFELLASYENPSSLKYLVALNRIKMEQRKVCGQQGEVGNNEEVKIENESPQIQTEGQELGKADTFGHCFIKQEDKDDKHTETTEALNRIKSEPNYVDWDPEYKNILEMEIENNKLDMEMHSQEFISKDDSDKNIDTITGIDLSRIKSEYSSIDNFNQCGTSENEDLKFQLSGMKPEVDMDTEEFEAGEITEEFAIKSEDETSLDATSNIPSNRPAFETHTRIQSHETSRSISALEGDVTEEQYKSIPSIHSQIDQGQNSSHKTTIEDQLIKCMHCKATFKSKLSLDDHIVRRHPTFVTSVGRKVYTCTTCGYMTVIKRNCTRHCAVLQKEIVSNQNPSGMNILGDEIVRKHPDFTPSVPSKIYECTTCNYKTVIEEDFYTHSLEHPKSSKPRQCIYCKVIFKSNITLDNHLVKSHPAELNNLSTCIHCGANFEGKLSLDDHVVSIHPSLATSVDRKVYTCTDCSYKTVIKVHFERHSALLHNETVSSHNSSALTHYDDHNIAGNNFIASVDSKIYECVKCNYKTDTKAEFYRHTSRHLKSGSIQHCIHCEAIFSNKTALDDHIVKNHPNFITSDSRKIYECTTCNYKTTSKHNFERHNTFVHTVNFSKQKRMCNHCNKSFKNEVSLDDHIVRKHPDFIASVDRKIYECTTCNNYKTTSKHNFERHNTLVHTVSVSNQKRICNHCNESFKNEESLDDHIVGKHPDLITTVDRTIYECVKCNYKTVIKTDFCRHRSTHPKSSSNKLPNRINCNATFNSNIALDNHIVQKHPDFITSVDRKIYECTKCSYKTTFRNTFERHNMLVHPSSDSTLKLNMCNHCTVSFKSKESLDDHIVRNHPDFITSVDKKIYECTKCNYKTVVMDQFNIHMSMKRHLDLHTSKQPGNPDFIASIDAIYKCTKCNYKTTMKSHFDTHTSKHPGNDSNYNLRQCIHCNAIFKSNNALDNHVVNLHPNFAEFVRRRVFQCTKCVYKTTYKNNFDRHGLVHSNSA